MRRTKQIPNPYARKILIVSKVNPDEMKTVIAKAKKYFDGNISILIREAIMKYDGKGK